MIVVSNTTPLNYLILIEEVHVLPALFGRLHVPSAVMRELLHPRSPIPVGRWAESPPDWIAVVDPVRLDPAVPEKLHGGESAALSLALQLRADRILLDDRTARRAAQQLGLPLAGTLSVLQEAAVRGIVDIERVVERLRGTTYRATEAQYQAALAYVREQGG